MGEAAVLAIALAMDATAVAAARGAAGLRARELVLLAASFGCFQAAMAGLGLVLGTRALRWIAAWDHWLAFGLLVLIGGKMVLDALRPDAGEAAAAAPGGRALGLRTVLILSIATSIDALAAGVTLPVLGAPPPAALALIGIAAFVLSLAGGLAGAALGALLGKKLELVGGLALIAIGAKTLVDHLR